MVSSLVSKRTHHKPDGDDPVKVRVSDLHVLRLLQTKQRIIFSRSRAPSSCSSSAPIGGSGGARTVGHEPKCPKADRVFPGFGALLTVSLCPNPHLYQGAKNSCTLSLNKADPAMSMSFSLVRGNLTTLKAQVSTFFLCFS